MCCVCVCLTLSCEHDNDTTQNLMPPDQYTGGTRNLRFFSQPVTVYVHRGRLAVLDVNDHMTSLQFPERVFSREVVSLPSPNLNDVTTLKSRDDIVFH